jgi:hypothetical protein
MTPLLSLRTAGLCFGRIGSVGVFLWGADFASWHGGVTLWRALPSSLAQGDADNCRAPLTRS